MVKNKTFHIGIIGLKPYFLGGYDWTATHDAVHEQIKQILLQYKAEHPNIVLVGGFDLGAEQIFFNLSQDLELKYKLVMSYDGAKNVKKLPEHFANHYQTIQDKSYLTVNLNSGKYGPKKVEEKYNYIIQQSDAVIVVANKYKNNQFESKITSGQKKAHVIYV